MKLNIQLFASGTINGSSTASLGRIRIDWSSTASDAIENKSSVSATVYVWRTSDYNTNGTFSGTLTINGNSISISKKRSNWNTTPKEVGSYTVDVPHNEDGTKTCNISVRLTQTGTSLAGTYTASADVQLDTIARASVFNGFSMSVGNDGNISIGASITKRNSSFTDTLNICNENFVLNDGNNGILITKTSHATAYNRFYQLMGNQKQANYTAVLTTSSSGTQIGNTTALTAYNVALPNYVLTISTITSSDDNANNYIRSGSTHKVSEFTSANTFLQGFSNPRLSYTLGATYNTLYGNLINITGVTTRSNLGLGNDSFTLGTNFTGGVKTLNVSDGRSGTGNSRSITLTRKDWSTPSVSIKLTRESSTGTTINWQVSWNYTSGSGNLTPKLNASYTYNGISTTLISDRTLTQTTGTLSGSFQLRNAEDYKYSISANATLTDTIDYLVQSNIQIPSGQPAIYCHKAEDATNIVDIYGILNTHRLEMWPDGISTTPYIDFHHNGSTADYTSRIIEKSAGVLTFSNDVIFDGGIRKNIIIYNQSGRTGSNIVLRGTSGSPEASINVGHITNGSKSYIFGYNVGSTDSFGIYSVEASQSIMTINKDGNMWVRGYIQSNNGVRVYKSMTFADFVCTLSNTDLGVDDCTKYMWSFQPNNWENYFYVNNATTTSIMIRGWRISGTSSASVQLINNASYGAIVLGVRIV